MQYDSSTLIDLLKYLVGAIATGAVWLFDRKKRISETKKTVQDYAIQLQKARQDIHIQKKGAELDFYEKTIKNQDERLETIWRRVLDLEKTEVERQTLITELRQQNEEYKSKINDLEDQLREFKIEMDDIVARLKQYEPDFQPTRKRKTKTA